MEQVEVTSIPDSRSFLQELDDAPIAKGSAEKQTRAASLTTCRIARFAIEVAAGSLPFQFGVVGLSQPHARPSGVFFDELDALIGFVLVWRLWRGPATSSNQAILRLIR
jgi:hypothetical protein